MERRKIIKITKNYFNMQVFKNVTISKVTDGGVGKMPSHNLVVTDEKYENKKTVGSLWTKESTYGKFLSGKMNDPRSYTNKEGNEVALPGYVIVREDELAELMAKADNKHAVNDETAKKIFDKPLTPTEQINMDEIPF